MTQTTTASISKQRTARFLNISQINLQATIGGDDAYGYIRDVVTNKKVLLGDGPREEAYSSFLFK